jgi:hypothetical protein
MKNARPESREDAKDAKESERKRFVKSSHHFL